MNLYIVGVYHLDPTCRSKLTQLFQRLSATNNDPPGFVATEWSENIFAEVKRQRSKFRKLLQEKWPHAPSDLLDALERSLGYEADTHTEIFPGVEVLWLDEGRQADVDKYAEVRLNMYLSFLEGRPLPADSSSALVKFSEVARKRAQPFKEGTERDVKFACSILERIAKGGGEWAVVIVGASHASDNEGSMRCLLEAQGQFCKVTIL